MAGSEALTAALMTYINGAWRAHAVYAAAELRIADHLAPGPQSSTVLAKRMACHPAALHRLLRALASLELCAERADGQFELRPLGALLCTERPDSLAPWALTWGRYLAPAWTGLVDSVRTGTPTALGDGVADYARLAADPHRAPLFNRSIGSLTARLVPELLAAWRPPPGSRIIDVGGGTGELLAGYLQADAEATGILFDQPPAITAAGATLQAAGVATRCECVAGNFFEAVPEGADVYILKSVLHDWDDRRATQILAQCAQALPTTGQLAIIERLAPPTLTTHAVHQASAAADLNLLVGFGGRVRNEAEFDSLLTAAGLQLQEVRPAGWTFAVLVSIPSGATAHRSA